MKKLLLLFLLLSFSLQAQIQKISELSKNKFLDSKIIYDDNSEDVWGYFLLYQSDKKDKSILELEFVVLDKNLNKVGSNTFQQEYLNTWLFSAYPTIDYLKKRNDELIIAIDFEDVIDYGSYFFKRVDLKNFAISSGYFSTNGSIVKSENILEKFERKNVMPEFFLPTSNQGFIKYEREFKGKKELSGINELEKSTITGYSFYDLDLNKKWEVKYNVSKDSGEDHYREMATDKYLIVSKEFYGKAFKGKSKYFYEVKDITNGKELFTIPRDDSQYTYIKNKLFIQNNKIYIFDKIFKFHPDSEYKHTECLGISKRVYNLDTKTLEEQKFMFWTDLTSFCEINKNGKLKGDYIHFLDFRVLSDGKTAVIGEGFDPGQSTTIKNFYTLVLDKDFKVVTFNEIEKQKNSLTDYTFYGSTLEKNNLFDYMYSQKIRNDEFVHFYSDNEVKRGFLNTIIPELAEALPDNWVLGIVTFADGEFKSQKLKLKTKKGKIYPLKAKKGYIILQEVTKSDIEIRLEKIDY